MNYPVVAIVPKPFDATDGVETPFGKRWGGDVIQLSADHLAELHAQFAESAKLEQAIKANLKGLGYESEQHKEQP